MIGGWSLPHDCQALVLHRLLVALWSASAIYFPPLCFLLTCYEIVMVMFSDPVLMANGEIQWIAGVFTFLRTRIKDGPKELNPSEMKQIIEEVGKEKSGGELGEGDWEEQLTEEDYGLESEC